jgi:hypothetical protein
MLNRRLVILVGGSDEVIVANVDQIQQLAEAHR